MDEQIPVVAKMSAGNGPTKRRSLRLETKRVREEIASTSPPLGYFQALPPHVVANVFDHLSLRDIGNFTMTSKKARSLFEGYMKCKSAKKRFHLYNQHQIVMSEQRKNDLKIHFQQFGVLMKRVTCLYQTKHRLQIVIREIFSLLNCNHYCHHECLPEKCPCLQFFGRFLHSLTLGWDYNECLNLVLNRLQEASGILGCLRGMFNSKAGANPHLELRIRHFYRSVFLDHNDNSYDLAFCLANILKEKSVYQKARLLFVLYGPCSASTLLYYEMCEVMPPLNPSDMQKRFVDFANVINMLHLYNFMSSDTVFAILHCIRVLPEQWLMLNFANLLISLDQQILTAFLGVHAKNGFLYDVGTWIVLIAMISNKYARQMDWIIDVLRTIFKMLSTAKKRFQLLKFVQDAFHSEIAEFHDSSAFELDDEINFNLMLSAAMQFNKCFFKMYFQHGLFKC